MEMRIRRLVHVAIGPLLKGLRLDTPSPVVAELAALKIIAASGLQKAIGLLTHMYNLYRTSGWNILSVGMGRGVALGLLEVDFSAFVVGDPVWEFLKAFDLLQDVQLELVHLEGPCVFSAERALP